MPDPTPHHRLSVHGTLGSLHLTVDLDLHADWTLLYGPSGSGKSTLLRAACGLLPGLNTQLTRSPVSIPGNLPPHLRLLSYAPQNASLFPHFTVAENIMFSSVKHAQVSINVELIEHTIHLFRLDRFTTRMPGELSGGERQRVNLARAFANPACKLLLLDEPFTGIDRALRNEILPDLRAALRLRNLPVLSVSHDVEEAFRLQCDVVKIRDGKIEAQGPAAEVLAAERNQTLSALSQP